jgi:hypothetical protein
MIELKVYEEVEFVEAGFVDLHMLLLLEINLLNLRMKGRNLILRLRIEIS